MNDQERKEKYFQLCKQYHEFTTFLGAYIAVAHHEGLYNNKDLVVDYVKETTNTLRLKAIEEGTEVLNLSPFPWKIISKLAQRHFKNSEEAKQWLQEIIEILQSTVITEN